MQREEILLFVTLVAIIVVLTLRAESRFATSKRTFFSGGVVVQPVHHSTNI